MRTHVVHDEDEADEVQRPMPVHTHPVHPPSPHKLPTQRPADVDEKEDEGKEQLEVEGLDPCPRSQTAHVGTRLRVWGIR
eukprot:3723846-Rhodomonas_salina.1